MKQGKLFFLTMLLIASLTVKSEIITEQKALLKAQQVLKGKTLTAAKSQKAQTRAENPSASESDFFFFNAEDEGGFVIVSASDRTESILGYSDQGHIDLDHLPDNLRYWLDGYRKQMSQIGEDDTTVERASTRAVRPAIEPLLKTTWGQDMPYKGRCPLYKDINCITGCVATAMAQVMYLYQYPA